MTEADKILPRIIHLLRDKTVLDLGCGSQKVVPWAVGVDDSSEWDENQRPDVETCIYPTEQEHELSFEFERAGKPKSYDVVFSSHALEHCPTPIGETLDYWLTFLRENGLLILYLPDERCYMYDRNAPLARNPAHHHLLTPETFRWHLDQIPNLRIEQFESDIGEDRYSFLVVARKTA